MSPQATAQNAVQGTDPQKQEIVQKAIAEISHIATRSEVTLKIISLVEDPDSTAQDLNKVISNDPALGARILKVANSAFYGLPGQIASINRAIVLLGLNAVKNIAIAASLAKLFRGGQICTGFDAKALWAHSIGVAAATNVLADKIGLGLPDEAFLAGLIHDLGIMVEVQTRRPKFIEAFEALEGNPNITLRQAEEKFLGANHEDFGYCLCKLWKFPSSLIYVTGFHHRPLELSSEHRALTCLVHIADIITARAEIGLTRTIESTEVAADILQDVNLTAADVDEICAGLPESMKQADQVLVDAG